MLDAACLKMDSGSNSPTWPRRAASKRPEQQPLTETHGKPGTPLPLLPQAEALTVSEYRKALRGHSRSLSARHSQQAPPPSTPRQLPLQAHAFHYIMYVDDHSVLGLQDRAGNQTLHVSAVEIPEQHPARPLGTSHSSGLVALGSSAKTS